MNETRESLAETLRRWAKGESSKLGEEPPAIEDLIAYRSGKLEGEARLDLERRLSVDPQAVEELLDLSDVSRLEPPTPEHRLSHGDQARALSSLRKRLESENPAQQGQGLGKTGIGRAGESGHASLSRSRSRWRALGLAAALCAALGGIWAFRLERILESQRAPRSAAVIDLYGTRGEGRPFEVDGGAQDILLLFPELQAQHLERGVFELSDGSGATLLRRDFEAVSRAGSVLYLPVPSSLLPLGNYRVEIYEESAGDRKLVQAYVFALTSSAD